MKKLPPDYAELLQPALEEMAPYEPEKGKAGLCLDANESPYPPSRALRAKVAALARRIDLNRYPDPMMKDLGKLAAKHYRVRREAKIVFGNGSDEIIGMLCAVFAGRGRKRPRLVVPTPSFSMYGQIARGLGYEVVGVPLDENFDIEVDEWTKVLVKKPANVIFLATPNNPTGNCYDPDAVMWLVRNSGAIVVVDEAYGDYGEISFADRAGKEPNLVVLKTLSKVGLASLRLGMAFTSPAIAEQAEKVRLPYNVSTFSQRVAELYFREPAETDKHTETIVKERKALAQKMRKLEKIEVFRSDANFLLFRTPNAPRLHKKLLGEGIRIRNLSRPGPLENCLRVTIGTPAQNRAFWSALRKSAEGK